MARGLPDIAGHINISSTISFGSGTSARPPNNPVSDPFAVQFRRVFGIELGGFEMEFKAPLEDRDQRAGLDEHLRALQSGDPDSSRAARDFLVSCGAKAAEHIVPKLSGFDTISGYLAMDVIEKLGSDAVPSLIQALRDNDKGKRSYAARALGKLGSQAAPAVLELLQALSDQDPTVYAEVSSALSRIGRAAVPSLISTLGSSDDSLRISAAWTLGRIGSNALEAVPALDELAMLEDGQLSQLASAALRKIKSPKTKPE